MLLRISTVLCLVFGEMVVFESDLNTIEGTKYYRRQFSPNQVGVYHTLLVSKDYVIALFLYTVNS